MILDMALLAFIAFSYQPVSATVEIEEIPTSGRKISVTSSLSNKMVPPPSGRKKSALLYYLASLTKLVTTTEESSLDISDKASKKNSVTSMSCENAWIPLIHICSCSNYLTLLVRHYVFVRILSTKSLFLMGSGLLGGIGALTFSSRIA